MNVPANLKYSNDHEWCRVEGGEAFIGITDFAQSQLGDIVFVDVPTVGETLSAGDVFGSIEAVKTVSDAFIPVARSVGVQPCSGCRSLHREPRSLRRGLARQSETDRSQGVRVAAYRRAVQRVDRLIFVRCKSNPAASRFRRVSAGSVRMESGIKRYRNVSPTCSVVTVFLFYIRNQYVGLALKL